MPRLSQQELEAHLWGAANILRGKTAGQDYKTYILSLLFFKRLCDQWDYEAEEEIDRQERERGKPFTDAQRQAIAKKSHRFNIPEGCHWKDVRNSPKAGTNVGEVLTEATRALARANEDLTGVFTVDWNQPAPDGKGKLIDNAVVLALLNHLSEKRLSNADVTPDILGRAYEYLIKKFADDAGQSAGEFFTPPEVVDCLVRILRPKPGETVYDPTCGSGGMLIHSADYLKENGHSPAEVQYFGQELNWSTYAIARINVILHGLDAKIAGGKSTLTEPQFVDGSGVRKFDLVIANFPFSDDHWWLGPDQQATGQGGGKRKKSDEEKDRDKKLKKAFAEFKDKYNRFTFGKPPAGYGDYAFIQHIIASLAEGGRAGVVCPQGVLFRGQPEVDEEADEDTGAKGKKRKADDEHVIREGLLRARLVDAVIALPLNVFYGAGVPACLLILGKGRPKERRDKVLLVYAARHFRELSAKNQLRPQDVMRILVHYHAYGDAKKAGREIEAHAKRLKATVIAERNDAIGLAEVEYAEAAKKTRTGSQLEKEAADRDAIIAEAHKQAEEELKAIDAVGEELRRMYGDPAVLAKHARVVDIPEIEENEFNLNIPRYVDTFEPDEPVDVADALKQLELAELDRMASEATLRELQGLVHAFFVSGVGHENAADSPAAMLALGWRIQRTGELLAHEPKNGISPPTETQPPGVITFSIAAVRDGRVDLLNRNHWKYAKVSLEKAAPFRIERGDILIVRGNANPDLVGKCGMVDEFPHGCIYPDILKRVTFSDRPDGVLPEFVRIVWNHPVVHNQVLKRAKTSNGTLKINNRDVKQIMLPVPPLGEQMRLVNLVRTAENCINALGGVEQALLNLKRGLMQAFLTGKMYVPAAKGSPPR